MPQRKLTAILAADVAGFTSLMEADEVGTLERLKLAFGDVFEPKVGLHGGRVIKFMGDGALCEFTSVVEAVRCALEVQAVMREGEAHERERLLFRMGVNLGDVIIEGEDIFGDGVNVAARLQALAAAGGIAISRTVREQIAGKIEVEFEDLGEHKVKNKRQPVHVFAHGGLGEGMAVPATVEPIAVAVMPFENKSGDPEQEYFSDGVTEDIITDLTKVSALRVPSRHAAFTWKGKAIDTGEVCRALRCTYVLEGSVRKAGDRVRITAQLVDGRSDSMIWAERYDRELKDIFAVQAEIAGAIVTALRANVLPAEKKALTTPATTNPAAYKLYLMARQYSAMGSERTDPIVVRLCHRAVELDPEYARAWALMAIVQTKLNYRAAIGDDGEEAAKRALKLDPNLADAHAAYARVLSNHEQYDEALAEHELALKLDPNSYEANLLAGRSCTVMRRHADAIRYFEKAAELLETDFDAAAMAIQNYEAIGDEDGALRASRRALERIERVVAIEPDHGTALGHGAGALAILGQIDRAKDWAERAMLLDPSNRTLKYNLACAMVKLKEYESALDYLDAALQQSQPQGLAWAKEDTDLDPLRSLPRYQAMIAETEKRLARKPRARAKRAT